jgi:nucleotide-binding universal stress UspA family protein
MMKFLVGYDGSNAANDAIALACKYAAAQQAFVHVVTSMGKGAEDNQKEIDEAQQSLSYAESLLEKDGVACQTHLLIRGQPPGEDLVRFAEENDVDLIFVGVKRRSKVGKLLLGSAAQYVILNAPVPVVSIR